VDDANGRAGRRLLRRFMRCLLRRDASVTQDLGRNAPTHHIDCSAAQGILEEFPKAWSFLAAARIIRTIEDIYVLNPETSARYSFKTKCWSENSAKDIRGAAWTCDDFVQQYFNKDLRAGRQFLHGLEAWLCASVGQSNATLISVVSPVAGGFELVLTSEQWHQIKQGHWVIIQEQHKFPQLGTFQYCFDFNGSEVGILLAVREPIDPSVHAEKEIVFDGPWADVAFSM